MTEVAAKQKKKLVHRGIVRAVKILDLLLMTVPVILCWYLYYAQRIASPFYRLGNYLVIALFLAMYYMIAHLYNGFQLHISRISELVYSQTMAALISDFLLYIVIWLLKKHLPNPLPLLAALAGQFILAGFWSAFAHKWYFHRYKPLTTAVIWNEREGLDNLISQYGLDIRYDVQKSMQAEDALDNLESLNEMHTVFLVDVPSHERNIIVKYCIAKGIDTMVIPRIGDVIMSSAQRAHLLHLPTLHVGRYDPTPEYAVVKRFLDIVLSLVALVIMAPWMLITAIAIKAYDGGPVFFKQDRLTKDGKVFKVIKFRSMRVDAEKDGVARLSSGENDPRITPVGRLIRKVRMDEWPQLFNIIKGDMSIVGPRPERPEIAAQYEEELPEFALRLQVKGGLTGYAQVYGQYNTTPYNKLLMDLMYIAHPSIAEDIKIVFATVKILFMPESTEGVEEGQITADK